MKDDSHSPREEKRLKRLRSLAPHHRWASMDEQLHCILCEQSITARTVRIVRGRSGGVRLACSTPGCLATPAEWVRSGNPLVSEAAWRDWMRLLGSLCDDWRPRPVMRRFRPVPSGPTLQMGTFDDQKETGGDRRTRATLAG